MIIVLVLFVAVVLIVLLVYYSDCGDMCFINEDCGSMCSLDEFNSQHDNHVRTYLKRVYPLASKSIDSMKTRDLAKYYNNLSIMYNCSYEYSGPLIGQGSGWKALPCSSNKDNLLPYVPDGYFYLWVTYAEKNKHTVKFSCALGDGVSYALSILGSQRPDIPWGSRSDGGEISKESRSGPGPYWVFPYSMVRNIYYPFGPYFNESTKEWGYRNIDRNSFAFTCKKWFDGAPQGAYIEVAHSSWEPGMVQSQGFWMTPFYTGGTGLFYRVGTTLIANNKCDALLKLLKKLVTKTSSDLNMPDTTSRGGTDFRSMSGKKILEHWYGTYDPYTIVWKYCANALIAWPGMAKTSSGGFVVVPSKWVGIDNKCILSETGLFNPGNIGKHGKPYGPNAAVTFEEVAKWYADSKGKKFPSEKDFYTYCINECAQSKDYILDRVGTIVSFDEPIFWLANILGIESVQLVLSSNANGLWSPELIHTVVPDNTWAQLVKGRIYDFLEGDDAKSSFDISQGAPKYTMNGLFKWQEMISQVITQRNPFNLKDGRMCSEMGVIKGPVISYDDKHFLQSAGCSSTDNDSRCWNNDTNDYGYKFAQCATKGQWGADIPGAQEFPGKTFWGHFNKESGSGCLPVYENIYCSGGLAADYSMLRLYSGKDLGRN